LLVENPHLNVDCAHLYSADPLLYQHLLYYPTEVIALFDLAASQVLSSLACGGSSNVTVPSLSFRVQVRPFNLRDVKPMRELNPEDIDKLISVRGMVIRHSGVVPELKSAFFRCVLCDHTEAREVSRGWINEPTQCPRCRGRDCLTLIHNRSLFTDKQIVKLQETPESIPEGSTPQTVTLCVYEDMVDVARPGDRVRVTGIYRACPVRARSTQRTLKHIYRTFLDVVHFQISSDVSSEAHVESSLLRDDEQTAADAEAHHEVDTERHARIQRIRNLARDPHIYNQLAKSFAPSIWELDDVKKGILCQLFGGTHKNFSESGTGRFRSEINILLCGDPGTSKSQLLQYVHKIAPRGVYTSGKGSSAVGLTAYIAKDPDTGEAVLESGALVLSDRGICCIDEFDKMTDTTRAVLHEVMEQQTVSVAKAGIICSLNARTSILASANPVHSKYNPRLSVVDNIQLPPTLLSRFDLIYLILDKPNPERDRRLAQHIVSLYFPTALVTSKSTSDTLLDTHTLTEYIAFARAHVHPVITEEAFEALVEGYVQMRRVGVARDTTGTGTNTGLVRSRSIITATPRQLEGLIRLSEAIAKIRLSAEVTTEDVNEALRLTRLALLQAATDPRSGLLDIDLITTGRAQSDRNRLTQLAEALRIRLEEERSRIRTTEDLYYSLMQHLGAAGVSVSYEDYRAALHLLVEEEVIALSGDPHHQNIVLLSTVTGARRGWMK